MMKTLLCITALCFTLTACYNKYEQELIVVNKVPRGAYAGEKMPSGELYDFGWYEIGLSRNGKEPIEYIWYTREGWIPDSAIIDAEIGERGAAYIHLWAKRDKFKLPRPNAKNPPVIGSRGEVWWEKYDDDYD